MSNLTLGEKQARPQDRRHWSKEVACRKCGLRFKRDTWRQVVCQECKAHQKDPKRRFAENLRFEQNGCWTWTGYTTDEGYGRFSVSQRLVLVHRYSYETQRGPIPEGLVLDHLCRNTSCVNPDHLDAVAQRVNILRGVGASAQNSKKTHCYRGHEFTPQNTGQHQNGSRKCLACETAKYAAKQEQNRLNSKKTRRSKRLAMLGVVG